jgi:hypothetical protein
MVAATSSTSSATAASTTDDDDGGDHNVIRDVVSVSDESAIGACGDDAPVACGSWVLAVATDSSAMASCAGLHRRPSYTCTPFPYRRHYAVRRKNGVLLPRYSKTPLIVTNTGTFGGVYECAMQRTRRKIIQGVQKVFMQ